MAFDPTELDARFAAPEAVDDDSVRRAQLVADIVTPLLERLPRLEREVVHMYFRRGMSQAQIAEVHGVSQPAISYRLSRAMTRMRYLAALPRVTELQLRDDLDSVLATCDVDVLASLWRTSSQTETAAQMGLPRETVRWRFRRALSALETAAATDERIAPYARAFAALGASRWNVLREVASYRTSLRAVA